MIRIIILCVCLALTAQAHSQKSAARDPLAVADSLYFAGDYKSAAPQYERALKKATNPSGQSWFRLGTAYHNLRDYAKALEAYRKAEKINANFPGLWVSMARTYSASGDAKSSLALLDSASRRGFGNFKLTDTDPDFTNLRAHAGYAALRARMYEAAYPCENLPAARQFDFWIGEWDVYPTANPNVKAGVNKITRKSSGCVIEEDWESTGPHNGVSLNYFDPVTGKWKQKWAGSGQDITEFYDGTYADGMMRFKFDIPPANGVTPIGRLTFTNLGPDKVRQHSEQSTDGGKTWTTIYDFTYVRR
jgi:hypothetical protein